MNNVGRRTVFLAKLGQLAVDFLVFNLPPLPVLRIEDVILRIMNDLGFLSLRRR
jgi:hypothetical protein